jgi:serine/threonine protein kinase
MQGENWFYLYRESGNGELILVKKLESEKAETEVEILKEVDHPNVLQVLQCFVWKDIYYLTYPYVRWTLAETITASALTELQIQYIACSVTASTKVCFMTINKLQIFAGIKGLYQADYIHNKINLTSVRVCSRSGAIFLSIYSRYLLIFFTNLNRLS